MESVPSTSTSRGRKHRASLSVEDMEKLRAADRLRKSRKKDEVNRQVIPATILCVYLFADMEVRDCRRMPLSSTERSRIHRAGESLNATERRRRSDRIRAQQNRAAETEQVEAARKAKIADRLRQVRLSQENADPPEIQSLDSLDEISIDEHYCGKMSIICASCSSRNFPGEVTSNDTSFTKCCQKGKVGLPPVRTTDLLETLMKGQHEKSKNFMEYIRSFNSSLAFASVGANLTSPPGHGPYCFRIHGQIYHRAGTLHPEEGQPRKFAQLYILDSGLAAEQRLSLTENSKCSPELMKELSSFMALNNPFAKATKMLHEVEIEAEEEARQQNQPKSLLFMAIVQTKERDIIRYNAPRANEVAIVFQGDDGEPPLNSSEKRSLQSFSPIHKED
ncbi:uncharacterized protein LOC110856031 [Folsomia candida]|nr:uncharacterized protein LOC110856031 [Folsomia candida]